MVHSVRTLSHPKGLPLVRREQRDRERVYLIYKNAKRKKKFQRKTQTECIIISNYEYFIDKAFVFLLFVKEKKLKTKTQ